MNTQVLKGIEKLSRARVRCVSSGQIRELNSLARSRRALGFFSVPENPSKNGLSRAPIFNYLETMQDRSIKQLIPGTNYAIV
jgi:hypothetical protein